MVLRIIQNPRERIQVSLWSFSDVFWVLLAELIVTNDSDSCCGPAKHGGAWSNLEMALLPVDTSLGPRASLFTMQIDMYNVYIHNNNNIFHANDMRISCAMLQVEC